MHKEHDRVVLTDDISANGLKVGDVGAIVHVYPGADAFVVEFLTLEGDTAAVVDVRGSQIRLVSKSDIIYAHNMKAIA